MPIIDRLLRLRTLFVAHYFDAEFKTLWALGLDPVFPATYDTWVAARALTLGRGHRSIELLAEARAQRGYGGRGGSTGDAGRAPFAARPMRPLRHRASFCRRQGCVARIVSRRAGRKVFGRTDRLCRCRRRGDAAALSGAAARRDRRRALSASDAGRIPLCRSQCADGVGRRAGQPRAAVTAASGSRPGGGVAPLHADRGGSAEPGQQPPGSTVPAAARPRRSPDAQRSTPRPRTRCCSRSSRSTRW